MYVNKTKKIAIMGMLAALSTVLVVLGTVISVNTVFFTAAAAFLAGIVLLRFGMGYGVVFFAVCAALDFLLNPNKLHVFLYLGFAGYLLLAEGSYRLFGAGTHRKMGWFHCAVRLVIFLILYLPILFFVPQLLIPDRMEGMRGFYVVMSGLGIAAWVVFDWAYAAFKKYFYERFGRLIR